MMGRRPIGGIFSVGVEEPYRWKDSVQSEPEIRLWVADGTANGMRPWFTKFSGVLLRPPLAAGRRAHLRTGTSSTSATCATRRRWRASRCCYSEQTDAVSRRRAPTATRRRSRARHVSRAGRGARAVRDGARGVPHAGAARSLQAADPRRRRGAVGRAVRRAPRATSTRGGSVLATFATSLYDERGSAAPDFGLADLFGVSLRRPHRRADAELLSEPRRRSGAPARATRSSTGLDDTPRIINGVFRVDVTADRATFPSPLTLVPTYPDLPMEDVYPRVAAHRHARGLPARARARAASSTSRGTSIARSGKCCASTTARLLRNAVALGGERTAAGRGRRAPGCST